MECINGKLEVGTKIIVSPDSDFGGLIGTITSLFPLGSKEHSETTDNDVDCVEADFSPFDEFMSLQKTIELRQALVRLHGEDYATLTKWGINLAAQEYKTDPMTSDMIEDFYAEHVSYDQLIMSLDEIAICTEPFTAECNPHDSMDAAEKYFKKVSYQDEACCPHPEK